MLNAFCVFRSIKILEAIIGKNPHDWDPGTLGKMLYAAYLEIKSAEKQLTACLAHVRPSFPADGPTEIWIMSVCLVMCVVSL